MNDVILFAHPIFGMLGVLASVWVFVEALNASEANRSRIRIAAFIVAGCFVAAWALGSYWRMAFYASEKAIILKGPWPWAHNFVMETKERLFFIPLILSLYLPIAVAGNLAKNGGARVVALVVAGFIVLNGLAIEGAGAVISYAVKVAFVHAGVVGVE
jgi:hypothetical protein